MAHFLPRIIARVQMSKSDHVFPHDAQFLSGVRQKVPTHI